MTDTPEALSNAAATTLGTLFLRQIERELARLVGRVQILSALVFPTPNEAASPDSYDSDLLTTLRTIAEGVQDHLTQTARSASSNGYRTRRARRRNSSSSLRTFFAFSCWNGHGRVKCCHGKP